MKVTPAPRIGATLALAAALAAGPFAAIPASAAFESPDAVLAWNVNATTAIVSVARQPPHSAILSFAMVQGAVYDAVNAIDGGYQPYLAKPTAASTDSKPAAVAAAARGVLAWLFPAQAAALQGQYDATVGPIPAGPAKAGGIAAGEAAAAAMIAARTGDGRGGAFTIPIGDDPGDWRPTPPAMALEPAAWVGNVKPFIIERGDQFRSDGPNALSSAAYAADFNEVKRVGAQNSAVRTADQTDAAIYWQDNGAALWNRIARNIVTDRGLGLADTARLLARVNLAGADGAISCWNDKYYWTFWRPITAIREAATDGNNATTADPTWAPLFATPAFPDHPSGHGCVSGSIVRTFQDFFGTDKVAFSAFSNNSGTTRHFARLSHALKEIIGARIWAGIHFRTADVQGSVIGLKVAHWHAKHAFQPVD